MKNYYYGMAAALLFSGSGLSAQKVVFKEDFESSLQELKAKGWMIPDPNKVGSTGLTKNNPISGKQSLEVISGGVNYANILVPVQAGKRYCGSVKLTYNNVRNRKLTNPALQRNRGAVMFFQLNTKEKKHLNGGSFPQGYKGTSKAWILHEVKETKLMPKQAAYINLTIGVESIGAAVFDDVVIYEMPEKISIAFPALNAEINDNRPVLQWQPKLAAEIKLSQDQSFPKNKTFILYSSNASGKIKPDFALTKGKWYWTVDARPTMAKLAESSFVIKKTIALDPVRITTLWNNQYTSQKPELKFKIFPAGEGNKIQVKVDGKQAFVKCIGDGFYSFVPVQTIANKVYYIDIAVNNKSERFVYSTTKRKNKISFRKDNTMLIDDVPFFPIGTYRDPSDWFIFTGVKEGGFNMSHSYYFEEKASSIQKAKEYLNRAEQNGIKVFMGINRKKIQVVDKFWIQNFCSSLKNYPALVSWYLYDEPIAHRAPFFEIKAASSFLKEVDSNTPVSILFTSSAVKSGRGIKRYHDSKLMNVFWYDYYPVKADNFDADKYYKRHIKAKKAAAGLPFWTVVQGSDLNVYPYAKTNKVKYPTPLQTRAMAHILLAAGSDGLIWYWGPKSAYHIKNDAPHVWKGICKTTLEIKKLLPYLVGDRSRIKLDIPGNIQYWSARNSSEQVVSFINLSSSATKAKITFPKPVPATLTLFGTSKTVNLLNGKLNLELSGYEVKIFTWKVE